MLPSGRSTLFAAARGPASGEPDKRDNSPSARELTVDRRCTRRAMRVRVGVHIGDVIEKEEDGGVYGDGVNIAARLQALADPGGITVSDAVRGAVGKKVAATWEDQGEQNVKNIVRAVRAFKVCQGPARSDHSVESRIVPPATLARTQVIRVALFQVAEGDPALKTFAQGLTEDIVTQLSHISALTVAAAEVISSAIIQGTNREQATGYLLQGSVRQASDRVRVTAKLVAAATGVQIWADKFDRSFSDSFEAQDDITRSIVASVQTRVQLYSGSSPPSATSAPEQLLAHALSQLYRLNVGSVRHARDLAAQAVALDAENPTALWTLAAAWFHLAYLGGVPWRAGADGAMTFARRAIGSDEETEFAHWALALAHLMKKEHSRALASLKAALELNQNFYLGYGTLGTVFAWAGKSDDSISNTLVALNADPSNPSVFLRHFGLALAHYLAGRYVTSKEFGARVVQARPSWWLGLLIYSAALGQAGEIREAQGLRTELLGQLSNLETWVSDMPFADPGDCEHLLQGLRRAGLAL